MHRLTPPTLHRWLLAPLRIWLHRLMQVWLRLIFWTSHRCFLLLIRLLLWLDADWLLDLLTRLLIWLLYNWLFNGLILDWLLYRLCHLIESHLASNRLHVKLSITSGWLLVKSKLASGWLQVKSRLGSDWLLVKSRLASGWLLVRSKRQASGWCLVKSKLAPRRLNVSNLLVYARLYETWLFFFWLSIHNWLNSNWLIQNRLVQSWLLVKPDCWLLLDLGLGIRVRLPLLIDSLIIWTNSTRLLRLNSHGFARRSALTLISKRIESRIDLFLVFFLIDIHQVIEQDANIVFVIDLNVTCHLLSYRCACFVIRPQLVLGNVMTSVRGRF